MIRVGWLKDRELNSEVLVILDEETPDSIEIQQALTYDHQDRRLGWDTYCLVRAGAATCYGGVEGYTFTGDVLELRLTAQAAAILELPQTFELELGVEGAALAKKHLGRLLSAEAHDD